MALASEDSPHWLHSAVEIIYTLKVLQKAGASLTGEIGNATQMFVTMILDVDENQRRVLLDAPVDRVQQERLSSGSPLILRGSLEGVRVEFEIASPRITQYENAPAIAIGVPERILKVQRRSYFRVPTPVDKRVTCAVVLPKSQIVSYTVVDIGLGGVALSLSAGDTPLVVGDTYPRSKIVLPDVGELEVSIQVCHTSTVRRDPQPPVVRYGCSFVDLRSAHETIIQRYVLQIERARRALTGN